MIVGQCNEEKLLAEATRFPLQGNSGLQLDCRVSFACDQGQTLAVKGTRVGARSRQRCRCGV
jgi:hypothetical protein